MPLLHALVDSLTVSYQGHRKRLYTAGLWVTFQCEERGPWGASFLQVGSRWTVCTDAFGLDASGVPAWPSAIRATVSQSLHLWNQQQLFNCAGWPCWTGTSMACPGVQSSTGTLIAEWPCDGQKPTGLGFRGLSPNAALTENPTQLWPNRHWSLCTVTPGCWRGPHMISKQVALYQLTLWTMCPELMVYYIL